MIAITGISTISALGKTQEETWNAYLNHQSLITHTNISGKEVFASYISDKNRHAIALLKQSNKKYHSLDDTVLLAIEVSRQATLQAAWNKEARFGINLGSSRGATQLFEKYHLEYINTNKVATLASPTTTLGNISSWVAHDLHATGPDISLSVTCSTAMHALLNGVAWLKSGLENKFLVGASESPMTGFTLSQMQVLKIYAKEPNAFPCRAFDLQKTKNSMVLGEAAGVACLEMGNNPNALAYIAGIGYAIDHTENNIAISEDGLGLQQAMNMALHRHNKNEVDVIIMHTPGTIKGDLAEYQAIKKVFDNNQPALTNNKWKVGHTLGASGMLSIELAILMMQHQIFIPIPYISNTKLPKKINKVLINATGFGGNAISILLSKAN